MPELGRGYLLLIFVSPGQCLMFFTINAVPSVVYSSTISQLSGRLSVGMNLHLYPRTPIYLMVMS